MENLNQFEVDYHTKPSPGSAYYQGTVKVYAEDSEQAIERARRELIRNSPDYRNSIVIDEVRSKR